METADDAIALDGIPSVMLWVHPRAIVGTQSGTVGVYLLRDELSDQSDRSQEGVEHALLGATTWITGDGRHTSFSPPTATRHRHEHWRTTAALLPHRACSGVGGAEWVLESKLVLRGGVEVRAMPLPNIRFGTVAAHMTCAFACRPMLHKPSLAMRARSIVPRPQPVQCSVHAASSRYSVP